MKIALYSWSSDLIYETKVCLWPCISVVMWPFFRLWQESLRHEAAGKMFFLFFFVYDLKSVGLESSGSVLDMFFRTVLLLCACFRTSTPVYQSAVAPFFVSFFFPFFSSFLSFFFPSFWTKREYLEVILIYLLTSAAPQTIYGQPSRTSSLQSLFFYFSILSSPVMSSLHCLVLKDRWRCCCVSF